MKKNNTDEKRQSEIIRVQKNRNFAIIDKGFGEDSRLSCKAKGILVYILGKPDNWKVIVKDIINNCADGKSAIYSGLRELKKYGYYKKDPVRDEKGQIIYWESVVYECPIAEPPPKQEKPKVQKKSEKSPISPLLTDFPHLDNQDIDNYDIENQEHNNIYLNQNELEQDCISINQQSEPETPDIQIDIDTIDNIPEFVADKISLDQLEQEHPTQENELKELYKIVCDTLNMPNNPQSQIRIAKQYTPLDTVKNAFMGINKPHISYVLDCLSKNNNGSRINSNLKGYYLTSLFNSVRTLNFYTPPPQKINSNSSFDIDKFWQKAVEKSMYKN